MGKTYALIAAAGQGKRMGAGKNKQYLELGGCPVLARTLEVFEHCPQIDQVIVVASAGEEEFCRGEVIERYGIKKVSAVITGGPERQDSIYNGLKSLPRDTEIVVIHDGARPLVTEAMIVASIEAAKKYGGAVIAVKSKDTIKSATKEDMVNVTLDRSLLWNVQTPQTFHYEIVMDAYKSAKEAVFKGTDDASLVEMAGKQVKLVHGSYENLKITTPEDLVIAEIILNKRKEGN